SSGKFSASAMRLKGLIKYRIRPEERVRELALSLSYSGGNPNFRQDVIDYSWLMDRFESDILKREDEKNNADRLRNNTEAASAAKEAAEAVRRAGIEAANAVRAADPAPTPVKQNDTDLLITVYNDDYSQSWRYY